VMKGLIIILTVLLQERNLGRIFAPLRWRGEAKAQDEKIETVNVGGDA